MKPGRIREKCFQQRLMITAQAYCTPLNNSPCKRFDHVLRLRSAIDIIANINLKHMSDGTAGNIFLDPPYNVIQEVCAAVNIANGINPCVRRKGRIRKSWLDQFVLTNH